MHDHWDVNANICVMFAWYRNFKRAIMCALGHGEHSTIIRQIGFKFW